MIIKKKPAKELPKGYVPPGGFPLQVGGPGSPWTWEKVAAHYGLSDVWSQLIEYNFPTVVHEKSFQDKCAAVNYYLEERVGCKNSKDGKNYTFDGASPGYIYVPTAPEDVGLKAAKRVLSILGSPYVHYIDFVLGDMFIHSTFFHKVGKAILKGKIAIVVDSALGSNGVYDWTTSPPTFALKTHKLFTADLKTVVIHEAVHAISHMKGKNRDSLLDESAAYVAQAIFHRKLTGKRQESGNEKADGIYQVADDLAQKLAKAELLGSAEKQAIEDKVIKVYSKGTYRYADYPFPT
jgi:hypothetical protein